MPSCSPLTMEDPELASDLKPTSDALESQCFPFLKLPPELRLHIYRLLLKRNKPILLEQRRSINLGETSDSTDADGLVEQGHSAIAGTDADNQASRSATPISQDDEYARHLLLLSPASDDSSGPPTPRLASPPSRKLPPRPPNPDPIDAAILRISKQIHHEARPILYSENSFLLSPPTALVTLTSLHQRTRSLIHHIELPIPSHHDILDTFSDVVRLGLRYCWSLRTFTIILPVLLFPDDPSSTASPVIAQDPAGGPAPVNPAVPPAPHLANAAAAANGTATPPPFIPGNGPAPPPSPRARPSTRTVYANAFHILRWLPRTTAVRLEGIPHEEIARVVGEHNRQGLNMDEVSF
ncbi:MAG: hypothetical protein M1819_005609 [Sarea resinae]|nr:MAG: hypothetical protein M1819_005609 [Sarea resinae]